MRTARALWLMLPVLLLSGCERSSIEYEMRRIERPGFAVNVPDASVRHDENGGATGKFQAEYLLWQTTAEVSWEVVDLLSAEDLAEVLERMRQSFGFSAGKPPSGQSPGQRRTPLTQIAEALREAFGVSQEWRRIEELPGQRRVHATMDLDRTVWMAVSLIQCLDTGVLATVSAFSRHRFHVEPVHRRMLEGFECLPDSEGRLVTRWPGSDLADDFGRMPGAGLGLVHADGRWLLVMPLPVSTTEAMLHGANRDVVLKATIDITVPGYSVSKPLARGMNLNGPAWTTHARSSDDDVLAISVFSCPEVASGYVVIAADDEDRTSLEALHALSLRLGCPGADLKPVTERPGACEVGAKDFCE